jgi:hypothetical protein
MDYNVIWLDECLDKFVIPTSSGKADGYGYGEDASSTPAVLSSDSSLSLYTFIKILNDFIEHSPIRRVSSRDVGRYFKSLPFDYSSTVSDEVKRSFGGLRRVVRALTDVYEIEDGAYDDLSDRSFWIEVSSTANRRLQEEERKTILSPVETRFFERYDLRMLDEPENFYLFTIALTPGFGGDESAEEIADHPIEDYRSWNVSQLKDRCRKLGLPVSVSWCSWLSYAKVTAFLTLARSFRELRWLWWSASRQMKGNAAETRKPRIWALKEPKSFPIGFSMFLTTSRRR